jgi:cytoskeletal protein CcmA (bactofilin family)
MQGLIAIMLIIGQISGTPATESFTSFEYVGQLPEIVVTAPRYENEDIAWSNMLADIDYTYATHKISGDYHLPEGDTIDEDITVTGGNALIDGLIRADLAIMGGNVDINGQVDGDVAVFGGNLDILGTIEGDAAVFGGNIISKGKIEGDLYVVGGTVELDSGSIIEGDISMVGGTVDRDDNAIVEGDIESVELDALRQVLPRISKVFRFPGKFPGRRAFTGFFFISAIIVLYILNLLVLLIFPRAIDRIIEKIQLNVWATVGFGLGTEILYIPLIILFAVSVIGIPLIPIFILAVFLGILFGFSGLSVLVGERVANGFNWKISGRFGIFSIGWLALMILPIIGALIHGIGFAGSIILILGMVILYVSMTIGLGGVVYALVKKGSKTTKK